MHKKITPMRRMNRDAMTAILKALKRQEDKHREQERRWLYEDAYGTQAKAAPETQAEALGDHVDG